MITITRCLIRTMVLWACWTGFMEQQALGRWQRRRSEFVPLLPLQLLRSNRLS